jgi:hypothetical protein
MTVFGAANAVTPLPPSPASGGGREGVADPLRVGLKPIGRLSPTLLCSTGR